MAWLHAVIDVPADQHAGLADFWGGALGWQAGVPWPGHPELRSFEPARGTPYLHLQEIEGAPRVHLDLEAPEPEAFVDSALGLGADLVAEHDRWLTLRSPGGLPFCVLEVGEHEPPDPVTWPDGHRSRMVQVCIDSPVAVHEREVAFWRALLPGRWASSSAPEFAGKWHDDAGSPLQLLFQRLDEPDGPVRAHLDHGTDDLTTEVRRVRDLGADEIGPGRGWHALRDPAGLPFCVTVNSPEQTSRRDIG
jgi:Glyoxalase-like domain